MKPYHLKFATFLLAIGLAATGQHLGAQVSIGQTQPDTNSVLDLRNPSEGGLVLPPSTSTASFSSSTGSAMTYFSGNHIFYQQSNGYNALTPWRYRFNGNATDNVYVPAGGFLNIGTTNLSLAAEAPLQIETDVPIAPGSQGSLLIGNSSSANLALNTDEIQSRQNGLGSALLINEEGGDIAAGSLPAPVDMTVSGRVQHLHQPTNTYSPLMPPGAIAMWFGATSNIPDGWAICDGTAHMKSDNSGNITTPDLQGRFMLSQGSNGSIAYAPHNTGGEDGVVLATNHIPAHSHTLSLNTGGGGGHDHSMGGSYRTHDGDGSGGADGMQTGGGHRTGSAGNHSHTVNGLTQPAGGAAHENRPQFYALVYIMKL